MTQYRIHKHGIVRERPHSPTNREIEESHARIIAKGHRKHATDEWINEKGTVTPFADDVQALLKSME